MLVITRRAKARIRYRLTLFTRKYRILSSHILLEGVDREESVLSATIVVIAVMNQENINIMLQLHVGGNDKLDNIGEEF